MDFSKISYCPNTGELKWANGKTAGSPHHTGYTQVQVNGKNYLAQIGIAGKIKYLGLFPSIERAKKAYQQAASEYFGEYALHRSRGSEA